MTTLLIPVSPPTPDTREAQDARWNAWRSQGAAADRVAQRRVHIAFVAILVAIALAWLGFAS